MVTKVEVGREETERQEVKDRHRRQNPFSSHFFGVKQGQRGRKDRRVEKKRKVWTMKKRGREEESKKRGSGEEGEEGGEKGKCPDKKTKKMEGEKNRKSKTRRRRNTKKR